MTDKGKKKSKISGDIDISTSLFSLFLVSSYFLVSIKNADLAKDPDMDPLNINFNEQRRENNLFFTKKIDYQSI